MQGNNLLIAGLVVFFVIPLLVGKADGKRSEGDSSAGWMFLLFFIALLFAAANGMLK